ncbi:ribonuclease H-like domain-containing protein [Chloroflexota bacterium]
MKELKEIFFDLETKLWSTEVEGGFSNISAFGLSVAATSWGDSNSYQQWMENDANELVNELERADKVIGFNILRFDYEVLSAYVPNTHEMLDRKSFDIFTDLEKLLGFRLSLEVICSATLGKSKLAKAEDAIKWWRQGQVEKVILYCQKDVELTKEIYQYGQRHGFIRYPRLGQLVELPVYWGIGKLSNT